jgi:hypothetical protein
VTLIIFGTLFFVAAVALRVIPTILNERTDGFIRKPLCYLFVLFGIFTWASTSFIYIPEHQVGLLSRVYGFKALEGGKIIATDGEKGLQSDILTTGTKFSPFINVIYSVTKVPTVVVPDGFYGKITAKDGKPLPNGMLMAPGYADDRLSEFLDAKKFLANGGYRGPQETVLKPGEYPINTYLFDVDTGNENTKVTKIDAGWVGVVKSNVGRAECREEPKSTAPDGDDGALSVNLVPKGCIGLWDAPLLNGAYYLNRDAFAVTPFDTRVQAWTYKGGFPKRTPHLSIDQDGKITTEIVTEPQDVPKDAADKAIFAKIEGWDVPIELRALVQTNANTAPVVVGSVGGMKEIEDNILTPVIRSVVRNVLGSSIRAPKRDEKGNVLEPTQYEVRPTKVLDLIDNRDAIEQTIEAQIKIEGRKAGLNIKEIRIGEPAIPPELLIPRLRQQLASQMKDTFEKETQAQNERIQTEQARATANQQGDLVTAQIAVQVANQKEQEKDTLGRGERKFLENLSAGQKAQALVLGEDRVAYLQALDKILDALKAQPQLVTLTGKLVPNIVVSGDNGGGLAGAAAILGQALSQKPQAPASGN